MNGVATFLGTIHIVAGLLLMGLAVPLIARRIPMNRWYGVRIPKSFLSDANWYAINSVGGWWLLMAGVGLAAAGIVVLVCRPASEVALILWGLAPVVVVFMAVVPILLYAYRLR